MKWAAILKIMTCKGNKSCNCEGCKSRREQGTGEKYANLASHYSEYLSKELAHAKEASTDALDKARLLNTTRCMLQDDPQTVGLAEKTLSW